MTNVITILQTTTGNPLGLHHSILKAAARRGFYFVGAGDAGFRLVKSDDDSLLSVDTYGTTSEALEAFDKGEVKFETPQQAGTSNYGKCGVMATTYHARYSSNPNGPGSGDQLDVAMRNAFTATDPGTGKPYLDVDALQTTGQANGVWNPSWANLNPGMRRMNLANRLRALLRNKPEPIVLQDSGGGTVDQGRFGIEYKGKAV